ncbi:response regulator [Phenylobacterium sp.]|uniref:response regulator n=1 Tax=Phenylobacterium sp. TaxID=1871053 RepID=UPI002FCBE643
MSQVGGAVSEFRVHVVDADHVTRILLIEILGDRGFDVLCLSSVAAYEALDHEAPTLGALIVDSDGGGITGFEVARYARRLNPAVPVIFLSNAHHDSVEKFGVPGAAHVAKPFDPDLLIMILRELAADRR